MKKLYLFFVIILTVVLLCGCSDVSNVKIDYGYSDLYTQSDMDPAIEKIISEFRGWDDYILDSLTYAGDKFSGEEELRYCNSLADKKHTMSV